MPALELPFSHARLLNGSVGDPVLYLDFPDTDDAVLFDAGENYSLSDEDLSDLTAVFVTHHHVDHFVGFDRIVRANIDSDKTLSVFGPVGTIQKTYDRIRSYEYQFFPFQKITLRVTEVDQNVLRTAYLECRKRFPPPEITETPWKGEPIFEGSHYQVEAGHLDHTVPCLGYSLTEREHFSLNGDLIETGSLRLCDKVLLDWGCGDGTNPFRAVTTALMIVLLYGCLYASQSHHFDAVSPPLGFLPKDGLVNRAVFGLMTSVSVFTAGFSGDHLRSAHGWVLLPLASEALLGTLLWGLFIVAFSRKVIR